MEKLTDQELLQELQGRLEFNTKALNDLRTLTAKLESVNAKLQESEALKGHFLANIRNEINNPLAAILGLASQLMAGKGNADRQVQMAGMIHAEAYRLDFQLQNIFMAAELEAGDASPQFSRTDVATLAEGLEEAFHVLCEGKEIVLHCRVAERLEFVTDARMVWLLLVNLLANAVEFTPAGGEIAVEAEEQDGALRLCVRDSGIGIDSRDHEAVFDRFRQLDRGTTKGFRGHGLGLSVTKALVEILGGRITLNSARGAGAEVKVVLPDSGVPAKDLARDGNLTLFEGGELF